MTFPSVDTPARKMLKILCCVCAIVSATRSVQADFIVLYNGTGLPESQPWLSYADNGLLTGGSASQSTIPAGVRLQSDLAVSAGYSNHNFLGLKNSAFPTLNRTNGFELSFALAIDSENHTRPDRAGFSVLMLGSDRRGIELGFWTNEIWAQNSSPLFTHGEGIALDTTLQRSYSLRITDDTYSLFAGTTTLLSGSVRDYTAFAGLPYTLPNYLFLGDNTSSGSANIQLGIVTLQSNLTAVPEPSSLCLGSTCLLIGYLATARRRKKILG
jgi:hypothetical protein